MEQQPFGDPYAIPFASTSAAGLDFSLGAATTPTNDDKVQLDGAVEGEEKRKKKRPRQVLSCECFLRRLGGRGSRRQREGGREARTGKAGCCCSARASDVPQALSVKSPSSLASYRSRRNQE